SAARVLRSGRPERSRRTRPVTGARRRSAGSGRVSQRASARAAKAPDTTVILTRPREARILLPLGRHREHTPVALAEYRRVVHLLGMRRRTGEDARRRGASDVGRTVAPRPELGRDVDHLIVA